MVPFYDSNQLTVNDMTKVFDGMQWQNLEMWLWQPFGAKYSSWHTPIYIDCTQHYFSQFLKFINPTVVFNISPFIDLNTMVLCVAVGVVLSFFSLPLHKIWILNCLPVGVSSCEFWKISYGITNGVEHGLFFLSYDWFFRGIINVRE